MKVRQHSHNLQAELPYEHIPLESKRSMRLVKISPADSWAPLKCEIIQVDTLDNAPAYEAILYTWGDYRIRHPLVCGPEGQILQVSESCISVLRRIRLSDVPRVVWVDAICINQDDDLERNTQVAMMGQIYHQAIRVIIDLGEESVHSNDAIDYIADCSETGLHELQYGLEIRDVIKSFYERPWFHRVWVLQEAYMSQEAITLCGQRWTLWLTFRPFHIWVDARAMREIEPLHVALPHAIPSVLELGNRRNRVYTAREHLLPLLVKGRTCGATDDRDRLFALLPMLDDVQYDDAALIADYTKPLHRSTSSWPRGSQRTSGRPSSRVSTARAAFPTCHPGLQTGASTSYQAG